MVGNAHPDRSRVVKPRGAMGRVFQVVGLALALIPVSAGAERANTETLTILPGPFVAGPSVEGDVVVLTVDDATGTGTGWLVNVTRDCLLIPVARPQLIVGQAIDPIHGPRWDRARPIAGHWYGNGRYRLALQAVPGSWTLTTTRGAL
jgi:hypothetical protein